MSNIPNRFEKASFLAMDEERKNQLIAEANTSFFGRSKFQSIDDHKHLRPGQMHVVMGRSGGGKSTWARSIVTEMARGGHQVFIYATEETDDQYSLGLVRGEVSDYNFISKISYMHEKNMLEMCEGKFDVKRFFILLEQAIVEKKPSVFFFDNITTSSFYGILNPSEQHEFIVRLRDLMIKSKIPFVIVGHVNNEANENQLYNDKNIRYSKTLTGMAEFLYAIQDVNITNEFGSELRETFIRVLKCRFYLNQNCIYRLEFHPKLRLFTDDYRIDFNKFHEFWEQRQRLRGNGK